VAEAPVGGDVEVQVLADGSPYGDTLRIPAGQNISNILEGCGLAALKPDKALSLDIVGAPQGDGTTPGAGLTVTIRF
jgi:hypothetical protein